MKNPVTTAILAAAIVMALSACGRKTPSTDASTPPAAAAATDVPRFKQTEKFGSVSNIELEPQLQVPAAYGAYVHQQASEVGSNEARKLEASVFDAYVKTWLTQAASIPKPDWDLVAAITRPAITDEGDAFKKQAAAEQAKKDVHADAKALDTVFGWEGEVLIIAGPDVSNGEYYLTLAPEHRYNTVTYGNAAQHSDNLYYRPVFTSLGMTEDNGGYIQLTVKVPLDKAREIESLRAGGVPMMRVYGHVVGVKPGALLRKDIAQAALDVDVQALEFGMRKDGAFKTFFFLDADQLKKSRG